MYEEDQYPKYFSESDGRVVDGVEERTEPYNDMASLSGFYHWVVEVMDQQFDRDIENVTHYDPFHPDFDKDIGYIHLSFPRGTKRKYKTAEKLRGKLFWNGPLHPYIGSFEGATSTDKWAHSLELKHLQAKWTTEKWEWEKFCDDMDEDGHDIGVAKVLDDKGHPFLIVDLCSDKHGRDWQMVRIIGKKHSSAKAANQGLTEAERWRLGMGLTNEQVQEQGEHVGEEDELEEDELEDEPPTTRIPSIGPGKRVRQTARKSTGGRPPKRVKIDPTSTEVTGLTVDHADEIKHNVKEEDVKPKIEVKAEEDDKTLATGSASQSRVTQTTRESAGGRPPKTIKTEN